jgi:hypothetical protein
VLEFEPLVRFPVLLQSLPSTFIILLTIAYFFFVKSFLDLKKRFPFWHKTFNVLTVYLLVGLAVALWMFAVPRIPITALGTNSAHFVGQMSWFPWYSSSIFLGNGK